jgi:hypothetical protein
MCVLYRSYFVSLGLLNVRELVDYFRSVAKYFVQVCSNVILLRMLTVIFLSSSQRAFSVVQTEQQNYLQVQTIGQTNLSDLHAHAATPL